MKEFYLAPRGSKNEVLYLAENWQSFLYLQETLDLPRPGLLLVPSQSKFASEVEGLGVPIALDNGAFQFLKVDFDGPLRMEDLNVSKWTDVWIEAVKSVKWEWVALLDVPVHGKKFVEKQERLRRIEITAKLHKIAFERVEAEGVPANLLRAVAQGFEPEEDELSINLHTKNLPIVNLYPFFALVSVCVRKDSSLTNLASGKARGTAEELRRVLDSKVVAN